MKWLLLFAVASFVQICLCIKSPDQLAVNFKALNDVDPKAVDDLVFIFKQFVTSSDQRQIEMIVCSATLYTIALTENFHKMNRSISKIYQKYSQAAAENRLIQETNVRSVEDFTDKVKTILEAELGPSQIVKALSFIQAGLDAHITRAKVDYAISVYHNALGISKYTACLIDFADDNAELCNVYVTCSHIRMRGVDEGCKILNGLTDVDQTSIDALCHLFKDLKTYNADDIEWIASYATVMTIALNANYSKTNQTVSELRQNIAGIPMERKGEKVSTEEEFLKKLDTMLSIDLDKIQTKEALNFASIIYHHGRTDDHKETKYVISAFHNKLHLSKRTLCGIVLSEICAQNCDEFTD